jgi:cellulose synthase/poly-beta-1,6-N-acetylglucosamine synthase-like glycosyltransferase
MDCLGKILTARGLISKKQLEHILEIQKINHCRLGDIVIAEGISTYLELYSALAEHYGLEFVNLLQEPPNEILLTSLNIEDYIRLRAMPWKMNNGKIIIAITEYSDETMAWIYEKFGPNIELVITSPLDIRKTIERIFGEFLEEDSKLRLWQQNPKSSARTTASPLTKKFLYILIISIFVLLVIFPLQSSMIFITFCSVSYFLSMIIKMLIFAKGRKQNPNPDWENLLEKMDDASLPIYTILVPMYKEKESLSNLLYAIENMDYPVEKLDIKLVLEADDRETLNAALTLKPKYNFEIIRVPNSTLRTKPKACNYALHFARGEYVTVFDADDVPDVLQLKKAVYSFRTRPDDIICLQARLNYYNADRNWLTRFFSIEYSILFDVMLSGLERLNIPLPLGGTSNHIPLAHLRELGEWDAYNVTEDADLGIRLSASGFRTAMLDSCTMEESPTEVMAWIRQRSRWIKGYMQTWLVHMRRPVSLYRSLGARSFFGFQFFVGFSSFTFLTAPILWALALLWWFLPQEIAQNWLPNWLIWLTITNLLLNFIVHWVMAFSCLAIRKETESKYKIAAFLYPFYLFLHSIASYKALYQLFVKPHFWEKTMHGISSQTKNDVIVEDSTTNMIDCPILIRV